MSKTAQAPFDDESADTILQSSDGVDFHVFRIVLSLASPFFKDLFSLRQPHNNEDTPIIPVPESSSTLDYLLRICYPIPDPTITNVQDIGGVLEAALKYEMEQATLMTKKVLREAIKIDPLEVFAVACRLNLEDDALTAARFFRGDAMTKYETLSGRIPVTEWCFTTAALSYVPNMGSISAGAFYRLIKFVRYNAITAKFCEPEGFFVPERPEDYEDAKLLTPPTFSQPDHDIVVLTSDGVDIQVHALVLSLASPVLRNLIKTQAFNSESDSNTLTLDEPASLLVPLMTLCYPVDDPEITDPQVAINLLKVASKYKMPRAITFIQRYLRTCPDIDPFQMFFTAVQHGWTSEAEYFASKLIYFVIEEEYTPEMEYVPANVYRALLKYHFECQQRINMITFYVAGAKPVLKALNTPPVKRRGIFRDSSEMIFAPIVQRAAEKEWRSRGQFDIKPLINETQNLEVEIAEALANVSIIPNILYYPFSLHLQVKLEIERDT